MVLFTWNSYGGKKLILRNLTKTGIYALLLPSYFILSCVFNQLLIILIPNVYVNMPYFAAERSTHAVFSKQERQLQKRKHMVSSVTSWRI